MSARPPHDARQGREAAHGRRTVAPAAAADLPLPDPREPAPWLWRRAQRTPQAEALSWPGGALDYRGLLQRATRAARALREAGVRAGDVVGVRLDNGPHAVVLVHALGLCGALLVPIHPRLQRDEQVFTLADAGARFLLVEASVDTSADASHGAAGPGAGDSGPGRAGRVAPEGVDVLAVAGAADGDVTLQGVGRRRAGPCADALVERADPEALLAVLYTSGTTGRPKGACLSARAFLASARASAGALGMRADDRWLACMPLFHVGGLSIVFRSVLAGSALRIHARFDARAVAAEFDADAVTLVSFVPTMLQRLLDVRGDAAAPARLRALLLGGGAARPQLLARARARGYPVAPTYGLTEACSQVATRAPGDARPPLGARLRPLPGVEVRIVDAAGASLPTATPGEIVVRGANLMSGYWRQPQASAEALRNGWLQTGDIGMLDDESALEVLDRRADLIVSGGENVYPAEIEAVLAAHPQVADVAVVAVDDREFGARPLAFVVACPEAVAGPVGPGGSGGQGGQGGQGGEGDPTDGGGAAGATDPTDGGGAAAATDPTAATDAAGPDGPAGRAGATRRVGATAPEASGSRAGAHGRTRPDAAALLRYCGERLASFKRPVAVVWLDALPRNAAGKLERARLRELARCHHTAVSADGAHAE